MNEPGTGFGFCRPTYETRISPPRTRWRRSGSWSAQRKGVWEPICKLAAWRYASQVLRVSSVNSVPWDADGATRQPAHMSILITARSVRDVQVFLRPSWLAESSFTVTRPPVDSRKPRSLNDEISNLCVSRAREMPRFVEFK